MNGRLITSTKNECVEASLKMHSENQHMDIMGMDYFVGTCGLMRRGGKKPSYQQKHTVDSPINRKHSARRPVKRKHSAKVASERKAFLCIEANQLNALCLVLGLMHLQENRLEAAHEH